MEWMNFFSKVLARVTIAGAGLALTSAAALSPASASTNTSADALLSQGMPATASSESTGSPAVDAVDGNLNTGWAPASGDQERYLTVDLGSRAMISKVVLDWGAEDAGSFWIMTTPAAVGVIWNQTLVAATPSTTGQQTINIEPEGLKQARYVRIYCSFACSLLEFQVYGTRTH